MLISALPSILLILKHVGLASASREFDKTLINDKLKRDEEKLKHALNELDPEKRASLLNDFFSR